MSALHYILDNPDAHLHGIAELLDAYGPEAAFESGVHTAADLRVRMLEAVRAISSSLSADGLRVFRAISVDDDWSPTWLGRHWTLDRGQAYPHDGDGADYIIVEALVDPDGIDLPKRIVFNMLSPDFSESEILVRAETELQIVSIHCQAGLPAFRHLWSSRLPAIPDGGRPVGNGRHPMTARFFGS
jgi:hypothetical protein